MSEEKLCRQEARRGAIDPSLGRDGERAPEHSVRASGMEEAQIVVAPHAACGEGFFLGSDCGPGAAGGDFDHHGGVRDHAELRRADTPGGAVGAPDRGGHRAVHAAVARAGAAAGVPHERVLHALRRGAEGVGHSREPVPRPGAREPGVDGEPRRQGEAELCASLAQGVPLLSQVPSHGGRVRQGARGNSEPGGD